MQMMGFAVEQSNQSPNWDAPPLDMLPALHRVLVAIHRSSPQEDGAELSPIILVIGSNSGLRALNRSRVCYRRRYVRLSLNLGQYPAPPRTTRRPGRDINFSQ